MAQQSDQELVEQYKQQFKADIDQHRNWSEDLDTDPIEKLTAFHELLSNYQRDPSWLVSFFYVQRVRKQNRTEDVKTQYMINGNNLKELKKLIQNFQPNAPVQLDYEDSGKNQIVQTSPIVSIGMRFIEVKKRNVGGYWPYLNLTTLDLSEYGIYQTFDEENYKSNCLANALKVAAEYISVDISEELSVLENAMQLRYIPYKNLGEVCDIINTPIKLTRVYDNFRHKRVHDYVPSRDLPENCKQGDSGLLPNNIEYTYLSIVLFRGHYMPNIPVKVTKYYLQHYNEIENSTKNYNRNRKYELCKFYENSHEFAKKPSMQIGRVLDYMLKFNCFQPMTLEQLNVCDYYEPPPYHDDDVFFLIYFEQIRPTHLIKEFKRYKEPKLIFLSKEINFANKSYKLPVLSFKNYIIRRVSKLYLVDRRVPIVDDILTQIFHLPLFLFNTLASYSQYIMEYFVPCKLLIGPAQDFIQKCVHGGQYAIDEVCKCDSEILYDPDSKYHSDFVKIDLNSAYTSAMVNMSLPLGYPRYVCGNHIEISNDCICFLHINVTKVELKSCLVKSIIKETGEYYLSNIRLNCCKRACHVLEYTILEGYYFDVDEWDGESITIPLPNYDSINNKESDEGIKVQDMGVKMTYPINQDTFRHLINQLYSKRFGFGEEVRKIIKNILNSIFGKSIAKKPFTKFHKVMTNEIDNYVLNNFDRIHKQNEDGEFEIIKPISIFPTKPQFGCLIIDWIVQKMQDVELLLIEETNCAPQLLCVDSFIIRRFQLDVLNKKDLISPNELGKFKIEGTYNCGIILSPRNWILYNNHEDKKTDMDYRATNSVLKYVKEDDNISNQESIVTAFKNVYDFVKDGNENNTLKETMNAKFKRNYLKAKITSIQSIENLPFKNEII